MVLPDYLSREPSGFIRVAGHRIGLHHVIRGYHDGFSPEMLLAEFPTLTLALIHKVIAFYLEHQAEVDAYIASEEAATEQLRSEASSGPTLQELRQRMGKLPVS